MALVKCNRCLKYLDDSHYTYRTKKGFYYNCCDTCRDNYKQYYDVNKEKIKEQHTKKLECNCGKTIVYRSEYEITRHLLTKYHNKNI